MLSRALISLVLFVSAFACGGGAVIMVNGIEVYESVWQKTVQQLESRASFDLSCSSEQLSFTLLNKYGRSPTEVGVQGCGNRAVYLRPVIGNRISSNWVMNGSSAQ